MAISINPELVSVKPANEGKNRIIRRREVFQRKRKNPIKNNCKFPWIFGKVSNENLTFFSINFHIYFIKSMFNGFSRVLSNFLISLSFETFASIFPPFLYLIVRMNFSSGNLFHITTIQGLFISKYPQMFKWNKIPDGFSMFLAWISNSHLDILECVCYSVFRNLWACKPRSLASKFEGSDGWPRIVSIHLVW